MEAKNHKHIICTNSDIILNSVAEGVFTVDEDMMITSFNRAAERITNINKEDAIGRKCYDVICADICKSDCLLEKSYQTGKVLMNRRVTLRRKDGQQVPVSISTAILRDENGKRIGGVETIRDLSQLEALRREISQKYTFEDIISKNHHFQQLFDILPNIAESESTVLIQGESGTGKELFARAIHNKSFRNNKQFIAINCGALPEPLLESELFGYVKGAFTDAKTDKLGRFALANNGTIFLDEIDSLTLSLQVKLLRVLEQKTFEPLGSTETIKTNIRIIAATKSDLLELVRLGKFRDDLYFRLNVIKLILPALKYHREDIPLLINHFIKKLNLKKNKNIIEVNEKVVEILMRHQFPGNVRELENIIEHAFVMCGGQKIESNHLPLEILNNYSGYASFENSITDMNEKEKLIEMLRKNSYNKIITAKQLGISRTTLWRKLKKFNISTVS